MANEIVASTTSLDREKFLAAKLVKRSYLKLVMGSLMDKVTQPKGTGLTAHFVRYKRMNVPLVPLSDDGQDPANSAFTLEEFQASMDEWGDVITITNVAELTTKHPLVQQAINLLADNAARVMDREISIVLMSGTNVQYGSGAVTSRATLSSTDKMNNTVVQRARITMTNNGAPPRGGPSEDAKEMAANGSRIFTSAYVGVCGPEVLADIMDTNTSFGTWVAAATYSNAKALYSAEVGTWLNTRWVETNFIPRFRLLGNTTAAVTTGNAFGTNTPVVTAVDGGGTLTSGATYYFKVTRKDLLRGFEEDISIEHSMAAAATGNNESFTFNFSSLTAGFVYNLYFGSSTGDANLKLAAQNITVGTTTTVTAVPSSTTTPPANNKVDGSVTTVHPVFIFGEDAAKWVGFYGIKTYITKDESIIGNVLRRRRSLGYSFFGKSVICDQTRLLRIEVASSYA